MPRADEIASFSQLFALFPDLGAIAVATAVPYREVEQWCRHGRVLPQYWPGIVFAARRNGIKGVTQRKLAKLPNARHAANFADLIALWPSQALLAADFGVPPTTVSSWVRRNSIPVPYWDILLASALKHGIHSLSSNQLHRIASASLERAEPLEDTACLSI